MSIFDVFKQAAYPEGQAPTQAAGGPFRPVTMAVFGATAPAARAA